MPSAKLSRESSLASSGRSTPYHERMDMDVVPEIEETGSRELSYKTEQERNIRVSMVANQQTNQQASTGPLGGNNEVNSTHGQYEEDIINV